MKEFTVNSSCWLLEMILEVSENRREFYLEKLSKTCQAGSDSPVLFGVLKVLFVVGGF